MITILERLCQDVRFAVRNLRRSKGFTFVACTALALGIGATTLIFSAVHALLLRPLPFHEAERLVMVWERQPRTGRNNVVSMHNYAAWQERNRAFEAIAAFNRTSMNLLGGTEPVQVTGAAVTADFFRVLGVTPLLGRTFDPQRDVPGAPPTIVLTHGFWLRHFGGHADVIGRRISVNVTHHEIIGVLPSRFAFPDARVQAFVPRHVNRVDGRNYSVLARLRQGISVEAAGEEMAAIAARTAEEHPQMNAGWSAAVVPLQEHTVGDARTPLLVLSAAVGFVLVIACANVANLLLMRAATRTREIQIRLALGAGRGRLVHQVVVESLLLAACGAVPGVALAWAGITALIPLMPATMSMPRLHEISIDASVLLFTVIVTIASAVAFGLVPALISRRTQPAVHLSASSRTAIAGHRRVQDLMVIGEIALALPLLAAAGLMAHSFLRLNQVEPGFKVEGVLTVRMLLLPVRDRAFHAEFVRDVLTRLRALPQVIAAGSIGRLPLDGGNSGSWYYRADRPEPPADARPGGDISIITPGYFHAMSIPVLRGRDFDERDRIGSPPVTILNQTAARAFFGEEDAVGKRLKVSWNDAREVEIVGIVADIRHGGLHTTPDPCLFMPNAQQPFPFVGLVVRTRGEPLAVANLVKREIRAVDPDQGVGEILSMEQVVADAVAQPKAQTLLFGVFSALALTLTSIGIYGVLAYAVAARTREIGLRLALGATPRSAFQLVLHDGARLTGIGLVIGIAAAMMLTRFMQSMLYEVAPLDPAVFGATTAVVTIVAIAACSIPAARATRVDPAIVLREE